jgi:hypothetical protein
LSKWIERQFLREVTAAIARCGKACVLNADETFARIVPHDMSKVIGHTNTRKLGRRLIVNGCDKDGMTCMATVSASGNCLPPLFLCEGT